MCLVWGAAVVAGLLLVVRYSSRGGALPHPPSTWPPDAPLERVDGKPTVVMLAHPRCPCTRASVAELAQIVTRARGAATFHVLFVRPDGLDDTWAESDTFRRASDLPGVIVTIDRGGAIASRLGATTSGHVLVYDAAGHLRFSGGITSARGHEGDNAGEQAVIALLLGGAQRTGDLPEARAETFGCGLQDERDGGAERTVATQGERP